MPKKLVRNGIQVISIREVTQSRKLLALLMVLYSDAKALDLGHQGLASQLW
jgi:hypothetical protein